MVLVVGGVFLMSLFVTLGLRRYALKANLLDTPNDRSSHQTPTARGGGLAFVIAVLGFVGLAGLAGWMPQGTALGLLAAGGGLAAIGWIDDKGHVSATVRLAVHTAAAGVLTFALGPLWLTFLGIESRPLAYLLSIGGVVWLINLVNFMDGIDGIAASEASFVGLGLAVLLALAGHWGVSAAFALVVAAAVMGFLVFNWPPASIFMGDVGSGFLGGMLGALMLMTGRLGWPFTAATLILLSVFLCDATVTLVRRSVRFQAVWQAHRSHAYQRLSRRWRSHLKVTVAVLLMNLLYLLPLACAVANAFIDPFLGIALAWLPVGGLVILAGAGLPDENVREDEQRTSA